MGALNLNFRDAENKLTVPDEGIEAEFSFIENEKGNMNIVRNFPKSQFYHLRNYMIKN